MEDATNGTEEEFNEVVFEREPSILGIRDDWVDPFASKTFKEPKWIGGLDEVDECEGI